MDYIAQFAQVGDVATAGGKGANLGELTRAGLPVPPGFVLTTGAYDEFVAAHGLTERIIGLAEGDPAAFEAAAAEIQGLFRAHDVPDAVARAVRAAYDGGPVAVRSSATAEDLSDASFAGQQDTYLNVRGADAVLAAIVDCWASLWTARAMAYRRRQKIAPDTVSLAVVVQAMVRAESAGVMFTANPANGRRDQIAISAAWGLGESVVGGIVSTDDLVVDATGVASRHTADKTEMTVYSPTGTTQRPVPAQQRTAPVLDDAEVLELARLGARIAEHFGAPQDIEWARADGAFVVVQSRPITALPEPVGDRPTTWARPDPTGLYFRASIVEQMPDPLTPLFADLVDGSVGRSIGALMAQAFGDDVLAAGDIGLPTINGYAYYHYRLAAFRRILWKSPAALRMLAGPPATVGGVTGWRERSHPQYVATVATWAARAELTSVEIIDGVRALLDAGTEYYTAVQSIVPLAATSELTFRAFHDRLVRRAGEPAGYTFLLGFDSRPIQAEKSLYDLATAARSDPALAAALARVRPDLDTPDGVDPATWAVWRTQFQRHLDRFGHTVYNLDFADPVPADEPGPLLDTVRFYLSGLGTDPYERQARVVEERERWTDVVRARLDPVRRAVFDRLLRWAQGLGPIREDALADMGLAWPVMRRMLRELGGRLVAAGVLDEPADVYWLRHDELRAAVDGDGTDRRPEIAERRMVWRGQKLATAPQMLPEDGLLTRALAPFMPAGDQNQTGSVISGAAGAAGMVTAPARVLTGPADFGSLEPGEVLVARITTPAWTSLFAMAAGVVTDVGGPLSHSSIVAREYGIPAVLGTGSATARIRTGQQVRIDGDAGTVTLLDEPDPGPHDPERRRQLGPAAVAIAAVAAGVVALRRRR